MLKQALEFDISKVKLGRYIIIAHANMMYNAMITEATTRNIKVFAFINNKHLPEKFQFIDIDVRDVIEVDNATIPVLHIRKLSV